MTAKEYLRSIKYLNDSINTKQRILDGLRKDRGRLCGISYDDIRVNTSTKLDPTEIIDKIDKLEREINSDIDRLVDLKTEAQQKIEKVYHRNFINLLTDIYINLKTFEEIAEDRKISDKTVCRWHGEALQIFRKENHLS